MINVGSVLNEFKFFASVAHFFLEATNTPGTAKVLRLNLTGSVFFFFKQEISRFQKSVGLLIVG